MELAVAEYAAVGDQTPGWTSSDGEWQYDLTFAVDSVSAHGDVRACSTWTLRGCPETHRAKLGKAAQEQCRGRCEPESRALTLKGTRLSDPDGTLERART